MAKWSRAELGTKSKDNNAINKGDKFVYTYCKQSCITTHHIQNKWCFLPLSKNTQYDCDSTNNSFLFPQCRGIEKKNVLLERNNGKIYKQKKIKRRFLQDRTSQFLQLWQWILCFFYSKAGGICSWKDSIYFQLCALPRCVFLWERKFVLPYFKCWSRYFFKSVLKDPWHFLRSVTSWQIVKKRYQSCLHKWMVKCKLC